MRHVIVDALQVCVKACDDGLCINAQPSFTSLAPLLFLAWRLVLP